MFVLFLKEHEIMKQLKLKAGCAIDSSEKIFEGFEMIENGIIANVGVDKIEDIMQHFILLQNEPLFFFLELPAMKDEETEIKPGIVQTFHKNVYYIDDCTQDDAMLIMLRVGNLLFNDGLSSFGYGSYNNNEEISFGKYNVLKIYSNNIGKYSDFFDEHEIEQTDNLITAWDIISKEHPGISEVYFEKSKSVFDIPEQFKSWGMYLAEQRESNQ